MKIEVVLLTLVERQTRFEIIFKLNKKDKKSIDQAINSLQERVGESFSIVFKTVNSDNGSDFDGRHETFQNTLFFYFSHQ